jgi:hypothetical protein
MNRATTKNLSIKLAAAVAPVCLLAAAPAFGAVITASGGVAPSTNVEIQQLGQNNDSDFVWRSDAHQAFGQTFTVGGGGFILDAVSFFVRQENDPPDRSLAGHVLRVNVFSVANLTDQSGTNILSETGTTPGAPGFDYGQNSWLRLDVADTFLAAGTYGMTIDFDFLRDGSGAFPGGHKIGGGSNGLLFNGDGNSYGGGHGFRHIGGQLAGENDLAFVIQSIPEPASLAMLGLGLPLVLRRRR